MPPAEGDDWTLLAEKGEPGPASSGTPENQPNTGVSRGADGGFRAGAVELQGKLTRTSNDGLVSSGAIGQGTIPATGAGTRIVWYPNKAAFRAGNVSGTQWDDANVGDYSVAMGDDTVASGIGSFAAGQGSRASGTPSVGMGSNIKASGVDSTAFGANSEANAFASTASNFASHAFGQGALALGYRAGACGDYSAAVGYRATTSPSRANSTGSGCLSSSSSPVTDGYTGPLVFAVTDLSSSLGFAPRAVGQFAARAPGRFMSRTSGLDNGSNAIGQNSATGCDLPAGSGSFQCASGQDLKEGFETVDGETVLSGLRATPVNTWRYKGEEGKVLHMGPFAEDFRESFGLGTDATIGAIYIDGVNFAAAKALGERTKKLQEENESLEEEVAALKQENKVLRYDQEETEERQDDLDKRLEELEKRLEE